VIAAELVCAASNFPRTPMRSRVEVFDPATLRHLRTVELGEQGGSLTWITRRDGAWWAGFANYDGRGGEPGRDHRASKVVRFDDAWRATAAWTYPEEVLARLAPHSASGGAFGPDGRLYVTGHDRPEIYVLRLAPGGGVMTLLAVHPTATPGQGFAFDPATPGLVLGVDRAHRRILATRLPPPRP
jgi:hypothetical protein